MSRIALAGTGRMGGPVRDRLLAAGHDVRILGRRAADDEVAAALADAEFLLICVLTDQQVADVALNPAVKAHLPAGATVVVHTTGSPATVQLLADHFASIPGVDVVDAPFSGGPHDIAAGHVTLFAGGAEAALARVRPVLAAYADPFLAVGPRGAGQQVKLVNNALFAAHLGLLSEAVRLAGDFGVAEPVLLSALTHASGASRALAIVAARGSVAGFAGTAREFLVKDLDVVRQVAAAQQADLGALDPPITRLADIVLAAVD